jgi:hypothetical protein
MIDYSVSVNEPEKRRLDEFIKALRTPCQVWMSENSWLNTEAFESEFRSKLLTHHNFIGSPLFQESFDSAFISACEYAGLSVERAPEGKRFWDVKIEGNTITLKSSKAQSLRDDKLHISKLTEAAWIQDCRTAKMRREKTFKLFEEYCDQVNAIIQLRYFESKNTYELIEIPATLFRQIFAVRLTYFSADGPTINIPIGKTPPDYTLKLDRSDAKITIANINKDLCLVHGSWSL